MGKSRQERVGPRPRGKGSRGGPLNQTGEEREVRLGVNPGVRLQRPRRPCRKPPRVPPRSRRHSWSACRQSVRLFPFPCGAARPLHCAPHQTYRLHQKHQIARREDEEDIERTVGVLGHLQKQVDILTKRRLVERPPRKELHRGRRHGGHGRVEPSPIVRAHSPAGGGGCGRCRASPARAAGWGGWTGQAPSVGVAATGAVAAGTAPSVWLEGRCVYGAPPPVQQTKTGAVRVLEGGDRAVRSSPPLAIQRGCQLARQVRFRVRCAPGSALRGMLAHPTKRRGGGHWLPRGCPVPTCLCPPERDQEEGPSDPGVTVGRHLRRNRQARGAGAPGAPLDTSDTDLRCLTAKCYARGESGALSHVSAPGRHCRRKVGINRMLRLWIPFPDRYTDLRISYRDTDLPISYRDLGVIKFLLSPILWVAPCLTLKRSRLDPGRTKGSPRHPTQLTPRRRPCVTQARWDISFRIGVNHSPV